MTEIKSARTSSTYLNGLLTAKYAGIQGMYYGSMAPLSAFASAFLLYKNFTNGKIGLVMALGAVGAAVMQLTIGNFTGKRQISLNAIAASLLAVPLALSLVLCIVPLGTGLTTAAYVTILAFAFSLPPFINSMNFMYQDRGISINYGIARAAGSVAYAALTPIIGALVLRYSAAVVPWFILLTLGGVLVFVATFRLPKNAGIAPPTHADAATYEMRKPLSGEGSFFRRNRGFALFLGGLVLVFMNNATIQTYLLQIILSKGGDSANLGITASIGAAVEIPMMVGFAFLLRRVKCGTLIKLSVLFMTLKAVGIMLAPSMGFLYLAQILHMLGFAMFTPASVYYVNQLMAEGDQVRGQAYLGSMSVMGGVVANFAGGHILDAWSPDAMLRLFISLSAVGCVLVFLAVRSMRKREMQPRTGDPHEP